MAVTKCSECGEKVSSTAKLCPHCGAKGPAKKREEMAMGIGCLVLIALVVGACIYFAGSHGKPSRVRPMEDEVSRPTDKQKAAGRKLLKGLIEAGMILRVDLEFGEVWVDPGVWAIMNRDEKEEFILLMTNIRESLTGDVGIQIKSYRDDALLGKFGILGAKIVR